MNAKTIDFKAMKNSSRDLKSKITDLESKIEDAGSEKTKSETFKIIEYLKSQNQVVDQLLRQLEKDLSGVAESKAEEIEHMFEDVDDAYRRALANYR